MSNISKKPLVNEISMSLRGPKGTVAISNCIRGRLLRRFTPRNDKINNLSKLAPELLKSGVKILLEARGKSMLPAFGPGDRLTVEPCGFDAIHAGDIVVYENVHELKEVWLVAHRVVKKEISAKGRFLLTKGDSPLQGQETLLDDSAVLGKVVHIQKVGRVGKLFRWIQRSIR